MAALQPKYLWWVRDGPARFRGGTVVPAAAADRRSSGGVAQLGGFLSPLLCVGNAKAEDDPFKGGGIISFNSLIPL